MTLIWFSVFAADINTHTHTHTHTHTQLFSSRETETQHTPPMGSRYPGTPTVWWLGKWGVGVSLPGGIRPRATLPRHPHQDLDLRSTLRAKRLSPHHCPRPRLTLGVQLCYQMKKPPGTKAQGQRNQSPAAECSSRP